MVRDVNLIGILIVLGALMWVLLLAGCVTASGEGSIPTSMWSIAPEDGTTIWSWE